LPLLTDNIEEARAAYSALEGRTLSAERLIESLQTALREAKSGEPISFQQTLDIRQTALDREADNVRLREQLQRAIVVKADLPLQAFIASIGLASALGEATLPDRTITSLAATLQTHLIIAQSAVGLHFFQTGIDQEPGSLSTTTFQLAKITPQPGVPAPRNLYSAVREKQGVYANAFWRKFATATQPPSQPAADIESAAAMLLANAANWNFPYLLQSALEIGNLEKTLSSLVAAALPGIASTEFEEAANSFVGVLGNMQGNIQPVAGDLFALTGSLDAVTAAAKVLLS
jgi:hypothetical protein